MATLTIRTDAAVDRALEALTADGRSKSDAVRDAVLESERALRRARMRAEAEALRNDPEDRAAAHELAARMGDLSAW